MNEELLALLKTYLEKTDNPESITFKDHVALSVLNGIFANRGMIPDTNNAYHNIAQECLDMADAFMHVRANQ